MGIFYYESDEEKSFVIAITFKFCVIGNKTMDSNQIRTLCPSHQSIDFTMFLCWTEIC
jgi:hypothetical protein